MSRRVVITGVGLVSPLGNSAASLWQGLIDGVSAVAPLTSIPTGGFPTKFGAEALGFTSSIDDFGPLEKTMSRNIKKNLKVMCREIQMGVAVAQLAITDAKLPMASLNLERFGAVYGSDYMLTLPQEFTAGIRGCVGADGKFDFTQWAEHGLPAVEPLWLLKYLPNLPASHVAIFNDLRGPNNSLTMREASPNLAVAEAFCTIERGHADIMLAGATGTRIHPARTIHVALQEEIARGDSPEKLSRPFDKNRTGLVIGEGAAAIVLEELESAQARGATILAEVIGFGASAVNENGVGNTHVAVKNALAQSLRTSKLKIADIDHLNAHGLGTKQSDAAEASAIAAVFGDRAKPLPVTTAKGHMGNLGAGGGMVEMVGSVMALRDGRLFGTLNFETPDPECPVHVATGSSTPAGKSFINLNVTPQGQASAVVVKAFA